MSTEGHTCVVLGAGLAGLCRSETVDGYAFDTSGHFLHLVG